MWDPDIEAQVSKEVVRASDLARVMTAMGVYERDLIPEHLRHANQLLAMMVARLTELVCWHATRMPPKTACIICAQLHPYQGEQATVAFLKDAAMVFSAFVDNDEQMAEMLGDMIQREHP